MTLTTIVKSHRFMKFWSLITVVSSRLGLMQMIGGCLLALKLVCFVCIWTSLPGPVGWLMEVWTSKGKCRTCRTYFSTSIGLRMIKPPALLPTIHHTRDDLYPPCRKWAKKCYEDFLKVGGSLSKKPRVNTLNQNFKMSPLELKCSTKFSSTICHCLQTTILCFNKCLTMELCMSCICCGIWSLHFQYQALSCP